MVDLVLSFEQLKLKFSRTGSWLKRAFEYSFRVWSIADVREAMLLGGFKSTEVYLSENLADEETFTDVSRVPATGPHISQMDSWNAYIIGLR